MAEVKMFRNGEIFALGAGDEVDLGAEFYRVWVRHSAGGNVSVAPGEPATGVREYGLAASLTAATYTRIAPDFPVKYVQVAGAGDVYIHASDAVSRKM